MAIMAKKEANRRAATLPSPSMLNGLHSGVGFVSDYASGAKISATSEELAAVQFCARRLVEGYGCSMSCVFGLDDHANCHERSIGVTTNDASQFSEPAKVGALE
jgi:hypothetical protein